jgi:hypothetical protein
MISTEGIINNNPFPGIHEFRDEMTVFVRNFEEWARSSKRQMEMDRDKANGGIKTAIGKKKKRE